MQNLNPKNYPLVTFVSPCYNHEKFIIQSLESIKNQTYKNIEHIIIDDASTDNSVKLIEQWITDNNYTCMFVKHTHNKGIGYALNESIDRMKGEYWSVCSTDDLVHPARTEIFVKFLLDNPDKQMVASDMEMINDKGNELFNNKNSSFLQIHAKQHPKFNIKEFGKYESLLFDNHITSSLMIKKELLRSIGRFKENLKMEDWDMWLRISSKHTIGFINEELAFYRIHTSNAMKEHAPRVLRKDMFQTFFSQKRFCYTHNKKKLFHNAYYHHFNNYYSPFKYPITSLQFHRINIFIFLTALCRRIKQEIKNIYR